jgi:ketosteroid isomerase-like protein
MIAARAFVSRVILAQFWRNMGALNAGDYQSALSVYAEDAVLRFNEGPHRWSGEHRGKAAIARFLRHYVNAHMQGEVRELYISGPLWRLTLIARFDDHAIGPSGNELYRNRVVLLYHTRWGLVVRQEDFTRTRSASRCSRLVSMNSGCSPPTDRRGALSVGGDGDAGAVGG